MARDHFIAPTAPTEDAIAVRLGAGSGSSNNLTTAEVGKFVKLAGESRYNLCAVGNEIEAVIFAVELAPQNQFTVGSVVERGILNVVFDGLQATPGTGVVAIGDYVVTGTPVAKDTALTTFPRVCKATAAATGLVFKWRVVSLGTAGTGAVGTTGVIEFVG
jgi:hypothetical protein